jgi:hypothetical protein
VPTTTSELLSAASDLGIAAAGVVPAPPVADEPLAFGRAAIVFGTETGTVARMQSFFSPHPMTGESGLNPVGSRRFTGSFRTYASRLYAWPKSGSDT